MDRRTGAMVLAAGKGSRMRSSLPKVLHPLNGRPMIMYTVDVLAELGFGRTAPPPVYVVGFGSDRVAKIVGPGSTFAVQKALLGTGHAASTGLVSMAREVERVLLIHGDEPLIGCDTYWAMLDLREQSHAAVVLLTGHVADTHSLGRVLRDDRGHVRKVVQEKDLTSEDLMGTEINFGAYVFDRRFMEQSLPLLEPHDGGEYYLTDLVHLAIAGGREVTSVSVPWPDDQMGINDMGQLERAETFLRSRRNEHKAEAAGG